AEDVGRVARQALDAAEAGLRRAVDDDGLRFTFFLLTQLVLAARETDWRRRLAVFGVRLGDDATLFDLTIEMQAAIDDHVERQGRATDLSELAQRAAGEAVARLA